MGCSNIIFTFPIISALMYIFVYEQFSNQNFLFQSTNFLFLEFAIDKLGGNHKITDFPQYDIMNTVIKSAKDVPIYKTFFAHDDYENNGGVLAYTGKDFQPHCFNQAYVHAIFYERVDIFILKDAYINGWEQLGTKGSYYDMYNYSDIFNPVSSRMSNRHRTIAGYKYVIAPIVRWLPVFAHWLTDCICPLLYVEDWIWDLNPVVCVSGVGQEMFNEYMKIIGHENAILVDRKDGFIYGETMFIVKGYPPEIQCGVRALPQLATKISEFYGLKNIKPLYYGYMNKDNSNRRITNLNQIIKAVEDMYNVNFIELQINKPDRKSFAKSMASIKLLICPGGSIAFNIVMMKKGTGFITLSSMCMDGPNLQTACHLRIWHIEIIHPTMRHFGHPAPGNITRTLYCFNVMDYAIKNQRWPSNHTLFCPYNFTLFKTFLTGKELPQNLRVDSFIPQLYRIYLEKYRDQSL